MEVNIYSSELQPIYEEMNVGSKFRVTSDIKRSTISEKLLAFANDTKERSMATHSRVMSVSSDIHGLWHNSEANGRMRVPPLTRYKVYKSD